MKTKGSSRGAGNGQGAFRSIPGTVWRIGAGSMIIQARITGGEGKVWDAYSSESRRSVGRWM